MNVECVFFRAPSNIEATCRSCGEAILPGEIVAEDGEELIHESCAEADRDTQWDL